MAKTVAYVATAILLGVVAMFPLLVFTPKRADTADQSYYAIEGDMNLLVKGDAETDRLYGLEEAEKVIVPSGPFHVGLILAISFVFAYGVSFYFKRKIF